MSFPKASIWQSLRQNCLDAIPPDSRASQSDPLNLAAWQGRGYYRVTAASKKQFELEVPSADFGGALLTDVECLLDNAAEHQVSLWKHVNSDEWISPAWLGVTVYYWSFYLVLATTRLTGRTAWHLTQEAVTGLKRLSPTGAVGPGAGCYHVACGAATTATERLLVLKRTDGRIHDEIWRLWFRRCEDQLAALRDRTSTSLEERLFTAIYRTAQKLGADWPSAFRNTINYRPGFAYTAVRRKVVLKSLGYLRKPCTYEAETLLDRFEQDVSAVQSPSAIRNAPQAVMELLIDLTFVMHAIATELHRELIERYRLDGRWRASRHRFVRTQKLLDPDTAGVWPL